MKTINQRDLLYSVIHDDSFDSCLMALDVELVLGIALKKLGLTALFDASVRVELGNGHVLCITVEKE